VNLLLGALLAAALAPASPAATGSPAPVSTPTTVPSNSPAIVGHWDGFMQRGRARLAVSFDFPQGAERGTFSAPDLGAIDIPLSNVSTMGGLHWELVGDQTTTTFNGSASGNSAAGTFREGERGGSFQLTRSSASTQKPYTEEDVTFDNGDVRLSGTVLAPRSPGRHAALLFVHGSGAEGRWGAKYLADYVARRGIVALIYDKRGVGASGGDWRASRLQDLIADARSAVALLIRRDDVDPRKIGVYGHSQGAEIAPEIAEHNPEVSWIVAADGSVGPQNRQDLFRVDTALAQRYSGSQLRDAEMLYAEFVDVARSGAPRDQLRADIARAGNAPWLADLGIPADDSWIWNWYTQVGNYDNTRAWGLVRVPVLVLFGGADKVVPPNQSIAALRPILKAHDRAHVTVRVFVGADHTLRVPPATPDGWPRFAAGFPAIIVEFANHVLPP
jgi:dienelactone hydrolase